MHDAHGRFEESVRASVETAEARADIDDDDASADDSHGRSLRLSVVAYLGLAIAPAFLFSVVDGVGAYRESVNRAEQSFLEATVLSAQTQRGMFIRARTVAEVLADLRSVRRFDQEECAAGLRRTLDLAPRAAYAVAVDAQGTVRCAWPAGAAEGENQIVPAGTAEARSGSEEGFSVDFAVSASEGVPDAVVVSTAMPSSAGAQDAGFVAVSLPIEPGLLSGLTERAAWPTWRALVDTDGAVLPLSEDATGPATGALMPSMGSEPMVGRAASAEGEALVVVATPLIDAQVWAAAATPAAGLRAEALRAALPRILAPMVMLIVALAAAYVLMERLVLRHIVEIAQTTRAMGRGLFNRRARLPSNAPDELRSLADDLSFTAEALKARESSLETTLKANRLLLMEVYHRVKNNLQMIGSFVNLQARRSGEAGRATLDPIRVRVHAMSLVHEKLYQSDDLETVALDELLAEVARAAVGAAAPRAELSLSLQPRLERQDRAVPLALFANESLTNAVQHGPGTGRYGIRLQLRDEEDGGFRLVVENDADTAREAEPDEGLGARLIEAFARQLRAQLEIERDDGVFRVTLVAPPPPERIAPGEDRHF
ncbi:MAG: sensor histidine kinase [Pseudomonadota bacterium]